MPNEEKDDMTLLAEAHERLSIAYAKLLRAYNLLGEQLREAESRIPINAPCRTGKGGGPKRATTPPAPANPQDSSPVDRT